MESQRKLTPSACELMQQLNLCRNIYVNYIQNYSFYHNCSTLICVLLCLSLGKDKHGPILSLFSGFLFPSLTQS